MLAAGLLAVRTARAAPTDTLLLILETMLIPAPAAAVAAVRPGDLRVVSAVLGAVVARVLAAPILEFTTSSQHALTLDALPFALAGMPVAIVCASVVGRIGDAHRGARRAP